MCNTCYNRGYNDFPVRLGSVEHPDDYERGYLDRQRETGEDGHSLDARGFCETCYNRGLEDAGTGVYAGPTTNVSGHKESYEKGYHENNRRKEEKLRAENEKEQRQKREDEEKRRKEKQQEDADERNQSRNHDTTSDNGQAALIKFGVIVALIIGAIWLAVKVVLPLLIINIAVIAVVSSLIIHSRKKYLFIASILGAVYIILDFNLGWFTKSLPQNVSFFSEAIPYFYYLNIFAGLVAAYFFTRDLLNDKHPLEGENEFSKRNLIIMGSLFLVGSLIVFLHIYPKDNSNFNDNTFQYVGPDNRKSDVKDGHFQCNYNLTMAVNLDNLIRAMSNNPRDPALNKAIIDAHTANATSDANFITLFGEIFEKENPGVNLTNLFIKPSDVRITGTSNNAQVLSVISNEAMDAIKRTYNMILTRIDKLGFSANNVNLDEKKGVIIIKLIGVHNPERMRVFLLATGKLQFFETYNNQEIVPTLTAAIKELSTLLIPNTSHQDGYNQSPVMGYVLIKDTAIVNKYLEMDIIKNKLPSNIHFFYGLETGNVHDTNSRFPLYAIKMPPGGIAFIEGDHIKNAHADKCLFNGKSDVKMKLDITGTRLWKEFTGRNIGGYLVMVLDGNVYSCLRVVNELSTESIGISGSFTNEEASDFANILNSGKLPAPVIVLQEQVVHK